MNLGNRHSQHSFAQIPSVNTTRSKFNRSFATKDTMDFDVLNPIYLEEVLPGDTINLNVRSFIRLATQVVPLMDNVYIDYFFFFVANRLVWENWEKFMGAQDDPDDSTDFLVPVIQAPAVTGNPVGSIYDHFGLPTGTDTASMEFSALPLRAYNLIWKEWFRDQNLQDSPPINKGDGPDPFSDYVLLKRAKPHDYFTSALPWPHKGEAITLPLGGQAPVFKNEVGVSNIGYVGDGRPLFSYGTENDSPLLVSTGSTPTVVANWAQASGSNQIMRWGSNTKLTVGDDTMYADLSEATAATINQFRMAIMTQSLLELDARGGTRYIEIIKAHFNVTNPDYRLQRPEFLSGGTSMLSQHVVAQTSETGETPQANLAAFSTAAESGNKIGFSKSFTEHGYVIGLMQARGEVTYQQGLNKLWSRETKYDFFWPKLQELGEQAVLNKEIYYQGGSPGEAVFGYQERYAEYRYRPSEIKGQFRSDFAESLDVWHLAQDFSTPPTLSAEFIEANTPIERSLVVTEGYPALLCDFFFDQKHARPMVTYGVPATLGRF